MCQEFFRRNQIREKQLAEICMAVWRPKNKHVCLEFSGEFELEKKQQPPEI